MDDTTRQLVFGLACPVVIAGALLLPATLRKSRDDSRNPWPILASLSLGLPPIVAFLALYGWPSGSDTWRTAAFAPILGLAGAVILAFVRAPWARTAIAAAVAVGVTLLIRPYTRPEPLALQILPAPAILMLLGAMEPLAARRRGPALVFSFGLAIGAATGLILYSGFLKLTLPLAALSFSTLVLFLCSIRRRDTSLAGGPLLVILPTTIVAVFIACLEAKFLAKTQKNPIPPAAFALVALSPLTLWLAEFGWVRARRAWVRAVLGPALVAIACATGIALALTARKAEAARDPYTDLYRDMLSK